MTDWATTLFAQLPVLAGYLVFGVVGFGTTLVAAPLLAHVLPVSTIIPALALTDAVAAQSNGWRLSAHIDRTEFMRLLPPMLLGSAVGVWILLKVPVQTLMLALGVFVFFYALNGLRPRSQPRALSTRWAWWLGLAGGTLSALFGAGGWVYSIYLVGRLQDPQQIRATQTCVLMVSSMLRVVLFLLAGRYFDLQLLWLALTWLPAMALGLYLGNRISIRLDRQRFLKALYSVLLLTGASLVLRALSGI